MGEVGGVEAIAQWQRGVVAFLARKVFTAVAVLLVPFVLGVGGGLWFFLLIGLHTLEEEQAHFWQNVAIGILTVCMAYAAAVFLPYRAANAPMATTAISEWQRAVCAVKFKNSNDVQGSCFVIDAERGLLWTCSHVVGQVVGETRQLGTSPAAGQPVEWMYEARVVHTTPIQSQQGLDGALLLITARLPPTHANGQPPPALHPLTHADGGPLPALPLGDDAELTPGEPLVLLGYPSATQLMTPTVGIFSTRKPHGAAGVYLLTDSLMLPGHSGGPGLNQRGQVVGWNVRDQQRWVTGVGSGEVDVTFANGVTEAVQLTVANGINQLRPVSRLVAELQALQGQAAQDAGGFAGVPDVRAFLASKTGCIAADTHVFGPAAFAQWLEVATQRAEAAAQQAESSQEAAEQSAQGAASSAEAARQDAGQASSAASNAQQAAIDANEAAAPIHAAAAAAVTQQARVDETLRAVRMALAMNCSHLSLEEQRAIMLGMAGVVPQWLSSVATLARIAGSCILILEVPGSVAQAAQDAARTRPEELAACGLLALRVAGENAVGLCEAGSKYIERLMAFDFSSFNTRSYEFVQTASAPLPLSARFRLTICLIVAILILPLAWLLEKAEWLLEKAECSAKLYSRIRAGDTELQTLDDVGLRVGDRIVAEVAVGFSTVQWPARLQRWDAKSGRAEVSWDAKPELGWGAKEGNARFVLTPHGPRLYDEDEELYYKWRPVAPDGSGGSAEVDEVQGAGGGSWISRLCARGLLFLLAVGTLYVGYLACRLLLVLLMRCMVSPPIHPEIHPWNSLLAAFVHPWNLLLAAFVATLVYILLRALYRFAFENYLLPDETPPGSGELPDEALEKIWTTNEASDKTTEAAKPKPKRPERSPNRKRPERSPNRKSS